ncbi:MAG: addiction module protein [bacterium]|nr:addiction module protein [bacterium]
MAISIPLDSMSVEEKIQVMEILWDDLCHKADDIQSPSWHKGVLNEREEALQLGADEFIDWDLAKRNIKKEIG